MGQPRGKTGPNRAKTGANLRPNRANIGQQQQQPQHNTSGQGQGHNQQPQQQHQHQHQIGPTSVNSNNNTTTTTTPARADGSAFAGARLSGVSLINPARGPLAVALPYGSSLLSVGERGRAPCRRPTPPHRVSPKYPAFYSVFCSSIFFPFFGSCGSRWVNMGQHRPQDGPT